MIDIQVSSDSAKKIEQKIQKATESAKFSCGLRAKWIMRDYIQEGGRGWPPLSDVSKKISGNRKPLSWLAEKVNFDIKKDTVSVGFKGRAAWSANRAEEGQTIEVTPKMRKYLAYKGFFVRSSTSQFIVPKRPIINPCMEIIEDTIPKAFGDAFEKQMNK